MSTSVAPAWRIEDPVAVFMGGHQQVVFGLGHQVRQGRADKAGGHDHFLDPQALVAVQHLVHEVDHMRAHHGRGNAHATGEVGGDDFIGAGPFGLVGVAHIMQAHHHAHLGAEQLH
jgi:hypothetical protein